MGTYIVKAGENIFDIALKLYGGIEGLFDLIASNEDAINQTGLSLNDTLTAGMKLTYTDEFAVNSDIASWLDQNKVKVRNGEHVYYHYDIEKYAQSYAKQYNLAIIRNAFRLWPIMKRYSTGVVDEKTVEDFIKYVNTHSIWIADITESDIPTLESGDYSLASNLVVPSRLYMPKMVVKQTGNLSTFTYNLKKLGVMIIDWGDNTPPEMCVVTSTRTVAEHCYEDAGEHVINIYGDIGFSLLDLRGIGGTYYPLTEIQVTGDFYSDLQTNTIINRLIKRT